MKSEKEIKEYYDKLVKSHADCIKQVNAHPRDASAQLLSDTLTLTSTIRILDWILSSEEGETFKDFSIRTIDDFANKTGMDNTELNK